MDCSRCIDGSPGFERHVALYFASCEKCSWLSFADEPTGYTCRYLLVTNCHKQVAV